MTEKKLLARGVGHAKLTLTLRVIDKRQDGFNNIEALVSFVDGMSETLSIYESQNDLSELKVISGGDQLDVGPSNLVNVAIKKFSKVLNSRDFHCELEKQIPVEAGLGGGSVDAALTLRMLNEIYGDPFSIDQIMEIASEIGSDVSACVYSQLCWMRGRGENISPVEAADLEGLAALVVTPSIRCATPLVYQNYDVMGRPSDDGFESPPELVKITSTIHNDLSLSAYDLYPELVNYKKELENITGRKFQLAGSGSTFFTLGNETELNQMLNELNFPESRAVRVGQLF